MRSINFGTSETQVTSHPANRSSDRHSFTRILDRGTPESLLYVTGEVRNSALLQFLTRQARGLDTRLAVDVGCGSGVLSWALASLYDRVVAVDQSQSNAVLAKRLGRERGCGNVEYVRASAFRLPLEDRSVGLVVLNGVLEWLGVNSRGMSPRTLQLDSLREVRRVLTSSGLLYLAIENRWAPSVVRRDPHVGIPLISALPRRLADLLSKRLAGRRYQTHIYGRRSLEQLLIEAGFSSVRFYLPIPSYQYPFAFISMRSREAIRGQLSRLDSSELQRLCDQAHLRLDMRKLLRKLRRRAALSLAAFTTGSFSCVACSGSLRPEADHGPADFLDSRR